MLYQRIAAAAAVLLLLGGCSFFGFWDAPETPSDKSNIDSHGLGGPLEGTQLAALPGYRSDQDVTPGGVQVNRGFIGVPSVRPARATASIPVQPLAPEMTLKDLLPPPQLQAQPQVLDLQPIAAAFEPSSFSLADLITDQDWRRQTSETLSRLFQ